MKYFFSCLLLSISITALSQNIIQRDSEIENMIQEINSDSLKNYVYQLVAFGTRNTLSTQINSKQGIGAARNYILQKFNSFAQQSNQQLTAYIDTITYLSDKKRVDRNIILGNVIATLKGTDTSDKRIFVITAHLDNMRTNVMDSTLDAPGANDDASGCATVLECARIMSKHSFPATIMFITVSGEEQGLLGANFLADKAKKQNWQIEAVLNNDIMGSNNSNQTNIINNTQLRVFSEGLSVLDTGKTATTIRNLGLENDGKSRQLARYIKEITERYVDNLQIVMVYRNDRFLRGGDHTPFVQRGFAAVRLTEMNENFYHQHQDVRKENDIQYGDLPEFLDYEYLRKNTAANLANLANLAKAPDKPKDVFIEVKKLSNTSVLHWKKPDNKKIKGYYVLIRETTSPVWQKKIFTEKNEIVLPFSKDNYYFAVQSLSETLNESLPVLPFPFNN